jgi:hypothetical protein
MLSLAEELLLLALDDEKGVIVHKTPLKYAIVGAILMDLALANRIDTDVENLTVVDVQKTGDDILDEALQRIAASHETKTIGYWLVNLSRDSRELEERLLERLIEKGILKKEEHKILWVFHQRRYPVQEDSEEREVKSRIRSIVLSEELPDPRDVVLVSLIRSCYLIDEVFTPEELDRVQDRIEQIARMDLIGQTVSRIIEAIVQAVAGTLP